jgi:methionyl aminopeptidase
MRAAAQLARQGLDLACGMAVRAHEIGRTTDDIDTAVHQYIVHAGAYPSPLGYLGFPKSICSSVNEVICHGIPDQRPLQFGDVVSFDVSCYLDGVHGDNCATVIVGDCPDDYESDNNNNTDPYFVASRLSTNDDVSNTRPDHHGDWRGIPYRTEFATPECEAHFVQARRLVQAARDCLYQSIATVHAGSCLTEIGRACDQVAYRHGYQSVRKYRGHGIASDFHIPPFVKHYTNVDFCQLKPGMIFTIEPMIVAGNEACFEWTHDTWTVATVDGSLAAQFEHTILVTEDGAEILTLP